MLAGPITIPSKRFLWLPILLRLVFFPLIILQVTSTPLVKSNYYAYAIAFILPLTGGYFGGLGMVYGPGEVDIEDREVAATIMVIT